MRVQKSLRRHGKTLEHGEFEVRETVHVCRAGCGHPAGTLVTRRAAALAQCIPAGHVIGYDAIVFVGLRRFLDHWQREEIRTALFQEHGLRVSSGKVSELARRFLVYLERLHLDRSKAIQAVLAGDGGWPLHVDATGEDGRGTLLVAMAGWRSWVLGAWKLPTERADAILPCLHSIVDRFGPPIAVVRDLGRAVTDAVDALVAERSREARVLACHLHFLRDVGNDLLDGAHGELRALFRRFKVKPRLGDLARSLGRQLGREVVEARLDVVAWQEEPEPTHTLPEGRAGVAVVRALAQWVLDYAAEGNDAGMPFDRPYLDLYQRCIRARRAVDAFRRNPPTDRDVLTAVDRLGRALDPVAAQVRFTDVARTVSRRAALFDELRTSATTRAQAGTRRSRGRTVTVHRRSPPGVTRRPGKCRGTGSITSRTLS